MSETKPSVEMTQEEKIKLWMDVKAELKEISEKYSAVDVYEATHSLLCRIAERIVFQEMKPDDLPSEEELISRKLAVSKSFEDYLLYHCLIHSSPKGYSEGNPVGSPEHPWDTEKKNLQNVLERLRLRFPIENK